MKRKSGYYWVKDGPFWFIAQYHPKLKKWTFCGSMAGFKDSDLTEINEERILPPNN